MTSVIRWHADAQRSGASHELAALKKIVGRLQGGHLAIAHPELPSRYVEIDFVLSEYEKVLRDLRAY